MLRCFISDASSKCRAEAFVRRDTPLCLWRVAAGPVGLCAIGRASAMNQLFGWSVDHLHPIINLLIW